MSIIQPEKIIVQADSSVIYNISTQTLVLVDSEGNYYSRKPGGLLSSFKSYKYFVINTGVVFRHTGRLCTFRNQEGVVDIIVNYEVKCDHINVNTLVGKCVKEYKTEIYPDRLVRTMVEDYNRSKNLGEQFYSKKGDLENFIVVKLGEYGLTVTKLDVQLDGIVPGPLKVSVAMFKVEITRPFPKVSMGVYAEAVLIPGQEVKAINNKVSTEVLEEEMLRIIRTKTSYVNTPEELFAQFNTKVRESIEAGINDYLRTYGRELGSLDLKLHKHGNLNPIIIQSKDFADIRLRNSRQLFKLKFKCELVADPQLHARVYLFPSDTLEMEELIHDHVRNTMAGEIDIEQFSKELNTKVSATLAETIDTKIKAWGRKVGYLVLETDSKIPPGHIEVEAPVSCITKDGHLLVVKNVVFLDRDNGALKMLAATQIPDIRDWMKGELDRITKGFVLQKTYNELFYTFDDTRLKEQIRKQAATLGYYVNHLVIVTEFQEGVNPERRKIEYKDYSLQSKVDGIPLAISLDVEYRIINYSKVMKELAAKEAIADHIENRIHGEVRQFFHTVHPDRFYGRFYTNDFAAGEEKSLEEEIKEAIVRSFVELFDAEVIRIHVNPLTTKVISRFRELQRGTFQCEYGDSMGYLSYKSKIAILSIDPERWAVFNARAYKPISEDPDDTERKDIAAHVKEFMEDRLNTNILAGNRKKYVNYDDMLQEVKQWFAPVVIQIKELFGLNIQIYDPVKIDPKDPTYLLSKQAQIKKKTLSIEAGVDRYELSLRQKKDRLELLYNQRKEKEANSYLPNAPDMIRIGQEIKALEDELGLDDEMPPASNPVEKLLGYGHEKPTAEDAAE